MLMSNPEYSLQKTTISLTLLCEEIDCRPEPNVTHLFAENATCNGKVTSKISELL